jgi:hypothetical protein
MRRKSTLKFASVTFAVALTLQAISLPANALVGLATLNWPLFVYGLGANVLAGPVGVVVGGVVGGVTGVGDAVLNHHSLTDEFSNSSDDAQVPFGAAVTTGVVTIVIVAGLGVIAMDGKPAQSVELQPLSAAEGLKLNLSEKEIASYNYELDSARNVLDQAASQFKELKNPTREDSARIWQSLKGSVSPETFTAMGHVLAQMAKH